MDNLKEHIAKATCRIISNYQSAYPDPLIVNAGETVIVGRNDTEWPGFVWCTLSNGKSGWMPGGYLDRNGDTGTANRNYNATELSVEAGEELAIHFAESGWAWCSHQNGQQGWVPLKHVELISPMTYLFDEKAVAPFDFEATVWAHGWAALRPFVWDDAQRKLSRIHQLTGGKVVNLHMQPGDKTSPAVQTQVETVGPLTVDDQTEIRQAVRRMFRLDEDLSEFYQLSRQMDGWNLSLKPGGGRLLRCPTLFEDIIYTLCTTNITWSGTKRMVERLTAALGETFAGPNEQQAFPTARAVAAAGPEFLKQETGLGYRSGYVWELASDIVSGKVDLTAFEDPGQSTEDLYKALRHIKGVGHYAAATILMLIGRYEHLAIDSEMRAFVSKRYFNGQPVKDAQIKEIYAPWGRWQSLAYWFEAEN